MNIDLNKVRRNRNFDDCQVQDFFKEINFKLLKKARILELGCGEGKTINYLNKNSKYECFGVDLLEKNPNQNFNFFKKNILGLSLKDFENKPLDFIYSFRVFCYLSEIEKRVMIKKIYNELLNLGGIALIDICGDGRNKEFIQITSDDIHLIKEYSEYEGFEFFEKKYKYFKDEKEIDEIEEYSEDEKKHFKKNLLKESFISYTLKIIKIKNTIEEVEK